MTMLTVPLPPALEQFIAARVAEGRYADAADFVRDLVRREADVSDDETAWLKALIDDGLASGIIDKDAKDVLREIISELPAARG
jgi:antitoxin ParD1/3/4